MEEGEFNIVEEQRSQPGEAGTEGERVRGAEVSDWEEEMQLPVDVLELEEPQTQV